MDLLMNKVSVIMPSYNNEDFIRQAINSVINQSYTNWELIIVDDCSTDNTYNYARIASESDDRISVYQLDVNSGSPSAPRNLAINKSIGDYLAFLDSDDIWLEEKLEIQIKYMISESIDFSYSGFDVINSEGQFLHSYKPKYNMVRYEDLMVDNVIGCLTVVVKKSCIKNDFINAGHEDFAFWLSILRDGTTAHLCGQHALASYRVVNESRSSNKLNAVISLYKLYREIEGLSLFSSMKFIVKFMINFRGRKKRLCN